MLNQLKQLKKSLDIFYEDIKENQSSLTSKILKIVFLDIENDDFWKIIKKNWSNIDSNSLDFTQLYEEYKNKKAIRNQAEIDSKEMSDIDLILKYNKEDSWLLSLIDQKKVSDKDIQFFKQRVLEMPELFDKRKISNYEYHGILSFKVFEDFPLSINVHLMLSKGISFNLLTFFTIRISYPEYSNDFSMNSIEDYYNKSIIFYEIIHTLTKLNFKELESEYAHRELYFKDIIIEDNHFRTINKYGSRNLFYSKPTKTTINFPPIEFKCFYVNMLNNSSEKLFDYLISCLEKVRKTIQKYKDINTPSRFYETLELELKNFYEKGKDLFLKSNELFFYNIDEKTPKSPIKTKKDPFPSKKIIKFLQKEFNNDISSGEKSEGNAGYRSSKKLFELYSDQINLSWATFDKYFKEFAEKDIRITSRKRRKKGGGLEYRINTEKREEKEIFPKKNVNKPILTSISEEEYDILVKFEEAMYYYNDRKYNESKVILKRIYNDYIQKEKSESELFLLIFYYLGQSYFMINDLQKAKTIFLEGESLRNKIESDNQDFAVELLKIRRWENPKNQLDLNKLSLKINEINGLFMKKLETINKKYNFINGLKLEELEFQYIESLKKNPKFSENLLFQDILSLELNLIKLYFLKLDYITKEIRNSILNNPIIIKESNGKKIREIPRTIQNLIIQGRDTLKNMKNIHFNSERNYHLLFDLFERYFDLKEGITKGPFPERYYRLDFEEVCPNHYYKFLVKTVNVEYNVDLYPFLSKDELSQLDLESQLEYFIMYCESTFKYPPIHIHYPQIINLFKNLITLLEYIVMKSEEMGFNYLNIKSDKLKIKIKEKIVEYTENYQIVLEKAEKRRKDK